MRKESQQLTPEQQQILEDFIKEFLPPRGNKRKNSGNELEYLAPTLDALFRKHFGFAVTFDDVLAAFERLNYTIFTKGGDWDWDKKDFKPSDKGEGTKILGIRGQLVHTYENNNAAFIYIDVDAPKVRDLRRTRTTLVPTTSPEKVEEQQRLLRHIDAFEKRYKE